MAKANWVQVPIEEKTKSKGVTLRHKARGEFIVGLKSTMLKPQEIYEFDIEIGMLWRPISFSVSHDIASFFEIIDIVVHRMRMNLGHPVSCSIFSSALCTECKEARVSQLLNTNWPILHERAPLLLKLRNVSAQQAIFSAAFEGIEIVSKRKGARLPPMIIAQRQRIA